MSPYTKFVLSPPKSSFKELIVSTPLRHHLKTMSEAKAVPKGLKDQEVEKGSVKKRPPIPYVPVVDEVQDAVKGTKDSTYTIKLKDKTQFTVSIWDSGTPEAFLLHVQTAQNACKRKGLFSEYEVASTDVTAATEAVANCHSLIAKARVTTVAKVRADATDPKAQPKATDKSKKADDSSETESEKSDPLAKLQENLKKANAELAKKKGKAKAAAEGFFSLYANLLSEDARYHWEKIVKEQCETYPWTNLQGEECGRERPKSLQSFKDCVKFHLLNVFRNDAAERERYYISNVLKKPQRVPVRYFFQRVQQLNGYLAHLPCLYYSPQASTATRAVSPFDDAELANLLLRMCPDAWQNQYDLTQETVPQDLRKLLTVLENIEKCELSSNAAKPTVPNGTGTAKPNGTNEKGKRNGTGSTADRIPKKVRTERHCVLCQKYGGRADSHNTSDCSKYEKDGTEKPGWVSKSPRTSSGKYKKPDNNSYAQIQKKIEKLEKAVKKGKKGSSSRKKKRYASSDSDSDSE